jgi:uncharacterized protein (TIGR02300 family)
LANPELGAKQICPTCQAKFYDLTRRPAVCPKCGTAFDPEEVVRSRRTRSRAAPDYETDDGEAKVKEADVEGAEDEEEEVDDTPELDAGAEIAPLEVDEDAEIDPGAPVAPDADLGVGIEEEELADEDDDAGVPFLEDEDEDDFPDDDLEPHTDEDH